MLVVKIEIWPSGDHKRKSEVGRLNIWNTGGPDNAATYDWEWYLDHEKLRAGRGVVHDRANGAAQLVKLVMGKLC